MAAGDRTDKIRSKVRLALGMVDSDLPIPVDLDTLVHDTIDDYQKRIAEELLCIETSANLTITSGTTSEPAGYFRLKQIVLPTGSTLQVEEVDVSEYDNITRITPFPSIQKPIYFKRWAGTWTFYPTPDNGTWSCFYYKVPSTNVSTSVDPETGTQFDKAIEYGVISDIAPVIRRPDLTDLYTILYTQEMNRLRSAWRRTKNNNHTIYYNE